jgi:uncharacterized protein (TIGR03435 family)
MENRNRTTSLLLRALWIAALPSVLGVPGAQIQPPLPAYKFEVAVIKPSDSHSAGVWLIPEPGGGFRAQNVVVRQLIKNAYYIRDQQLTGGPAWIKTDRYDITAKPEETEPAPLGTAMSPVRAASHMARHRQRIQALLRDRFGLVLGTETRVQPFYSLKLAKTGNKMDAAGDRDGDPVARMGNGRLTMTTDMKGIAAMLTDIVGRPVIDETGLSGHYNVKLEWTPDTVDAGEGGGSIFTAVKEQLGLQLESKKGPVPVFVIEKIERPSEN